jgi:hypothetical protein
MTTELVTELRYAAGDYSLFDKHMGNDAADTIERLEHELLAATIRIDNDAMEIARLTPLQYRQAPCHKFCEATAFQIEIQALKAERDAAVAESLEQSRLLGMGSEREAALLGKVDRLELDQVSLREELSKVTDELFALSQDDGKVERALDRADAEIKKLRAELDAAIAVWTSVDDALPEKNVECLVYWGEAFGSPLIGVAQRCVPYEGILMWRGHGGSHNDVTHWMPPPKRPAPGAPLVKAGWVMAPKESA